MRSQLNEPINIQLMENAKKANDWSLNKLASELYWWVHSFNIAFFEDQPVPLPVISFEKTKITSLGHYVPGRNPLGLLENINLNLAHLKRPLWDVLATLLHEMCHSWQKIYGTPSRSWFHNKEFQQKMLSFGIVVNTKGCHLGVGNPFVALLEKHGVQFPQVRNAGGIIEIPAKPKSKGRSKLKKWSCGCTNIRVAVKDFEARCLKCGNRFELVS